MKGQSILTTQNFGSTSTLPTGWSGTNSWAGSISSPSTGYTGASGTGKALFSNTGTNGLVGILTYTNNFSTIGYTSITVLWGARLTSTFAQPVTFQWSTDGSTWNTVSFSQPASDGLWYLINGGTRISLTAGAAGASNLRFRWQSTINNNGTYSIDDFTVQGTASTSTTISSLSPSSGCIGSSLTINGTNLTGATSVTIGGTTVSSITSNSSTQIVAVVGSGTTGTVSVNTPNGTATSSNQFTVNADPTANASGGGTYCVGATIQLTGGPSGYDFYSWSGPNGYSSIVTQPITENFDGMGSQGTANIPTGFVVGTDWSTGTTSTTQAAGTSGAGVLNGSSNGGTYNFANGVTASATDRSLGFLTSSGFSSPRSIILKITNNTGATVTNLTITFDYEKYRAGTRSWDMNFFHGSTSTPNIAATSGDQIYPADVANAVVDPPTTISKNISLIGLSISNGSSYYLKWTSTGSGGSTNGQGIGIDDVSIVLSAGNMSPSITNATTAMSGNYILTATNTSGCTATATTNVVVNPNPLTSNIYHE